mgnify:CR=1 FL=1
MYLFATFSIDYFHSLYIKQNKVMQVTIGLIELIISIVVLLSTGVGVWTNLQTKVTKLSSRVYHLEQSDNELKTILADISTKLHKIELLLAANQIKEK